MRLTLRTLLAYLDDTLPPGEIRAIGQKVAESDTAQELIERIKQVTRRRRLTTPPSTGPVALDANTTAEYLDNELSSEQVLELEKLAIESDVHLAELAACHQILTLVLGEPLQVPPTARERMYGLVQGRESLSTRRAPRKQTASEEGPDHDADEKLLPGLSLFHQAPWLRWVLPLAGGILLLIIGLGLGRLFSTTEVVKVVERSPSPETSGDTPPDKPLVKPPVEVAKAPGETKQPNEVAKLPGEAPKLPGEAPKLLSEAPKLPGEAPKLPGEAPNPQVISTKPPPSKERGKLGRYQAYAGKPSILVARNDTGDWQRIPEKGDIYSADQLISLPGYASEINLDSGGQILMRGLIPEMTRDYLSEFLLESVVTLHSPSPPGAFDVELTLNRGRIYLTNNKERGSLRVRLRLAPELGVLAEVWDLELKEPGSEVGVELQRFYFGSIKWEKEPPLTGAVLVVLSGQVSLKRDAITYGRMEPPGKGGENLYFWNNKGGVPPGPTKVDEQAIRELWNKLPLLRKDAVRELESAPQELSVWMGQKKAPGLALKEAIDSDAPDSRGKHMMAIYALGALDMTDTLIGVLGDSNVTHDVEREKAVFVLRCWLTHGVESSKVLYNRSTKTGEFTKKGYTYVDAANAVDLLHDFSNEDLRKPETYRDLVLRMRPSNRVAIREVAWRQMQRMSRGVAPDLKLPPFNAAWTEEMSKPALDEIDKLIAEGRLPPVGPSVPRDPRDKDK